MYIDVRGGDIFQQRVILDGEKEGCLPLCIGLCGDENSVRT